MLEWIVVFRDFHGFAPHVSEVADGIGVTSHNAVWLHLNALRDLGLLHRSDGRMGVIEATPTGRSLILAGLTEVKVERIMVVGGVEGTG